MFQTTTLLGGAGGGTGANGSLTGNGATMIRDLSNKLGDWFDYDAFAGKRKPQENSSK
jgi:hypothetical protein